MRLLLPRTPFRSYRDRSSPSARYGRVPALPAGPSGTGRGPAPAPQRRRGWPTPLALTLSPGNVRTTRSRPADSADVERRRPQTPTLFRGPTWARSCARRLTTARSPFTVDSGHNGCVVSGARVGASPSRPTPGPAGTYRPRSARMDGSIIAPAARGRPGDERGLGGGRLPGRDLHRITLDSIGSPDARSICHSAITVRRQRCA